MKINNHEDYVVEALEMVSAWEVPEENFVEAVLAQSRLMAGDHLEPLADLPVNDPYLPLQF